MTMIGRLHAGLGNFILVTWTFFEFRALVFNFPPKDFEGFHQAWCYFPAF
jgi:hypothetical protein